ncbi:hypothetical protein L1887_14648 [Cichorium endivia]|nr:hypothetical protein L1887_14648 [Cichorium endivia]
MVDLYHRLIQIVRCVRFLDNERNTITSFNIDASGSPGQESFFSYEVLYVYDSLIFVQSSTDWGLCCRQTARLRSFSVVWQVRHKNRGGFVRERCSFNKEIEHVKAKGLKICAEFLGGSFNCDAYHMTSTHPVGKFKLKRMKRLNSPFDHLEYLMLSNIMVLFNMSKSFFLKFIKRAMADALQRDLEKAMSHKFESQNALANA